MLIRYFAKRKQRKMLSELRWRRHAEDDLLTAAERTALDAMISEYGSAAPEKAQETLKKIEPGFERICKPWNWMRNLLDLLIVVGAVAFGIRGLFLQPFKIPTGSMQPTLYGIHFMESTPLGKNLPGWLNYALFSVRRAHAVTKNGGELELTGYRNGLFNDTVHFMIGAERHSLPGTPQKVMEYSGIDNGKRYIPGETVADGFLSMGDHLFVERFSLYWKEPVRGEIMVFTTDSLTFGGMPLSAQSGSYYVKRLVALPGDTVRLKKDQLWIRPAGTKEFRRLQELVPETEKLYSGLGGYQGHLSSMGERELFGAPADYTIPAGHYFMLGDNSQFSLDSRFFGSVPRRNLVGRTWFVFWPFSRRWGTTDRQPPIKEPTGVPVRGTFPVMYLQ